MKKKFTLLCVSFFLVTAAFAQTGTISGKVINSVSYEPLPFATVFINHTTIGTAADGNGDFVLKNIPFGQHELAVMFVGHNTFQMKVNVKDTIARSLTIKLTSKPLQEIQVSSDQDKKWRKQYERFEKLFLGNSVYADRCKILNPWVLDFGKSDDGFFVATANDVLEIENHSLGYKLFYILEKFSYGSSQYQIGGTVRFEVLKTNDTTTIHSWIANRQQVYTGSERHLFKSIIEGTVREEGFNLYRDETGSKDVIRLAKFEWNFGDEFMAYAPDNLVFEETGPNKFKLPLPKRLEVHFLKKKQLNTLYKNVDHPISWIEVKGGHLLVDNRGIVLNPAMMVLSGSMGTARIAELLPYDFQSVKSETVADEVEKPREEKFNALSYLLEKPYIHTDKSYYYPNEMLWLKGYMNYKFPVFRDSLSRVVYVELINTSREVVMRKILPIQQGSIIGNCIIPPSLSTGDYTLRAYTRWMLNFDETLIFSKPIKILDYTEVARPVGTYPPIDTANQLTMIMSKDTFHVRELVTVRLGVLDFLGNFTPSNFSIAVTDLNQAVPASNERTIINDFAFPEIILPDAIHPGKFLIQYGIDLKGQLSTKRGKHMQGTLKLLQENTSQDLTIITEENGTFSFSNLNLFDTTKLFGQAKTIRGLNAKISLDTTYSPPPVKLAEQLKIDVYRSENPSRYNTWDKLSDAHVLKEITIEDTRLTDEEKRTSVIASDFSITGERLRENNTNDVLLALRSMVPGLRVIQGMIVLGEASTFGNPEPLVLIDGMAVNGFDSPGGDGFGSESAAATISNLTVQQIERIEVSKYSSGAVYGSRGSNGVIAITTRKPGGDINGTAADKRKFEEITFPRFSAPDRFYAPDYADIKEEDYQRPDYRSTIYWNPLIMTDHNGAAQISFFSADIPTQYRIVVEGVTKDGTPVRGEKIITISATP